MMKMGQHIQFVKSNLIYSKNENKIIFHDEMFMLSFDLLMNKFYIADGVWHI